MLKTRFDFRKWRTGSGTLVGSTVVQEKDFSIRLHQRGFAQTLSPIKISAKARDDLLATA